MPRLASKNGIFGDEIQLTATSSDSVAVRGPGFISPGRTVKQHSTSKGIWYRGFGSVDIDDCTVDRRWCVGDETAAFGGRARRREASGNVIAVRGER